MVMKRATKYRALLATSLPEDSMKNSTKKKIPFVAERKKATPETTRVCVKE